MDNISELSAEYYVSAGDSDAEGHLAWGVLVQRLIEVATDHANELGVGNPNMSHLHCGWVLSRLKVECTDMPRVNTSYRLTTWVETWNGHFSDRSFEITDCSGNILGQARSVWMVLDTRTHESRGLGHLSPPEGMVSGRTATIRRQRGLQEIIASGSGGFRNTAVETTTPHNLRYAYTDLDFYRHVNTVRYVETILDQFTLDEMDNSRVRVLEMQFKHEGYYNASLTLRRRNQGNTSEFTLYRNNNEAVLNARITLEPLSARP